MLNMDPITLRAALAQLEQATRDHVEWQENLLRAIVCGLPFNPSEVAEDAHLNCRFGRWYYEQAPAELWGQPVFTTIGREHERLHRAAARLLREVAADAPIVREDFEELLRGLGELRLKLDLLRDEISSTLRNRDALTGAYDRAEMLPRLREWHELAKRHVQPCCLVFMDLDHFKDVNDRCGHGTGDEILAGTVRHLSHCLRPYDKVFRYGGDEFLICLPGADLAIGQSVIKRVRESLARQPLVVGPESIAVQVSASFGLALLDPEVGVEDSIERADQALLLAKTVGRNRAISWDPNITTGTRLPRLRMEDFQG
jgi:diguanylate cyclase